MAAKIVVMGANRPERDFWIEEAVLRIGADASCALRLTGREVAPHSATLEYLNGSYVLYNRTGRALALDGRPIPSGGWVAWPDGETLVLDDVALRLEVDGEPAPSRRPVEATPEDDEGDVGDDPDEAEPASEGAGSGSRN